MNARLPSSVFWLITRLANMSKEKGNQRRATVFKCFASIICAESSDENGIAPYLEVMLEALHRPIAEEDGASANNRSSLRSSNTSSLSETTDLPKEVMTSTVLPVLNSIVANHRDRKPHLQLARVAQQVMLLKTYYCMNLPTKIQTKGMQLNIFPSTCLRTSKIIIWTCY